MSIPHNNKEIPAEYRTRGAMIQKLQEGNCRVIFKKVNGEERDMMCTLQESVLPKLQSKPNDKKRQPNETVIRAFDINKQEFRSFRVENVISFVCNQETDLENVTVLWFLLGAASFCSYMIGRAVAQRDTDTIICTLLDWLVENDMVKTKTVDGELELIPLNEK